MGFLDKIQNPLGAFLAKSRSYGLEYTTRRYYSKYFGTVVSTDDPQGQGRIMVKCESVSGRDEVFSEWAYPSSPFAGEDKGFYFPPDPGDHVWVWFDHGDPSQPRYSGGVWINPVDNKRRSSSYVPAEFSDADTVHDHVTTRGIKTQRGHGVLFEDATGDAEKPTRVEVWTGEQTAPRERATQHHRVVLDDYNENIVILSYGGHSTRWIDRFGEQSVTTVTKDGLFHRMLDYAKRIETGTPAGYQMKIDEQTKSITIQTPDGASISMLDGGKTVTIADQNGNTAVMSATGVTVNSTKALTVNSELNMTFLSKLVVAITSTTAMTLAAGAALNITAVGLFKMLAGVTAQVSAPQHVWLGKDGDPFWKLVDERFAAIFNEHIHKDSLGGDCIKTGTPLVIGSHTTTVAKGN